MRLTPGSRAPDLLLPVRYRSMAGVRTVLTGGTGVIGRAAVPALLGAGHDVVVVTRCAAASATVTAWVPTPVRGDVLDMTAWPPPTRTPTP